MKRILLILLLVRTVSIIAMDADAQPTQKTLFDAWINEDKELALFAISKGVRSTRSGYLDLSLTCYEGNSEWLKKLAEETNTDIYQFFKHPWSDDIIYFHWNKYNPKRIKRILKRKGLYSNPFWQRFKSCSQEEKNDVLKGLLILENNINQEKHIWLTIKFGAQPTIETLYLAYRKKYQRLAQLLVSKKIKVTQEEFFQENSRSYWLRGWPLFVDKVDEMIYGITRRQAGMVTFMRMQDWYEQAKKEETT